MQDRPNWEIIDKTINFKGPDRLGIYYLVNDRWDSDIYLSIAKCPIYVQQRVIENSIEKWKDEWGNTWARHVSDSTTKGEILEGALVDWSLFDDFHFPDWANSENYTCLSQDLIRNRHKYLICGMPGFYFSVARNLRGLENFLVDILIEKSSTLKLLSRLETLFCDVLVQYAKLGVDAVFFCEDWGTQNQLLISPNNWREIFKPYYSRFCEFARRNGISIWMHSCGYIYEIIADLIEVGIQVLQIDQPELMQIERIGKEFGGKVTFWSPCDIQKVLPTGNRELISHSIQRMCENWFVNGGGFIAKSYGTSQADLESIGVKSEWNEFAYKCFKNFQVKQS
jgi:hypothetical protein